MAWVRAGIVTGEPNTIDEFDIDTSYVGSYPPAISSTAANTGAYSVRCGVFNTNLSPSGITFAGAACVRVSFWFRHSGMAGAIGNPPIIRLIRSGGVGATVTISSSSVSLIVGGTTQATATPAQCGLDRLNTWQHLALTYYTHASTGYVTFYVDGVAVLTYTGAVSNSPVGAYIGGSVSSNAYFLNYAYYDDLYVDTSSSAETDKCPDALRFVPKALDGTTSSEWTLGGAATAHAALASNDGDTSYLLSTAAGDLFVGTLANATIPAEYTVSAVHVFDVAKRGDALSTLKTSLIDGSANTVESAEMTPGTSYGRQLASFDLAPDGGAWDNTKVNDIALGIESAGSFA